MKKTFPYRAFVLLQCRVPLLFQRGGGIWLPLLFLLLVGNADRVNAQCNGLHFDGENDYVRANSPFIDNSDFTLEMWFRSDNTNSGGACGNNSLADFRWLIGWDDNNFGLGECHGNLRVVFNPTCPLGTGLCEDLPTVPIQDGLWHHVAFSKSAATGIRILVDGNLLANFSSGFYNLSGFYRLGSSGSGTVGKNWLGAIDEVRIWNVARSDAQIQASRNCQLDWNEPGLVTLFRGNIGYPEGPNPGLNTLTDLSASHQNGTLFNFKLDGPTSNWVSGPEAICDVYCAPPAGEITLIAPIGEVLWAAGDPRTFIWTKAAGYDGLYRLKIKQLAAGEEAPFNLPDTGLFYDKTDINDTSFVLPPAMPVFDTLARYAWQVETVGTVGGVKKKSPPDVIIFPPYHPLNLTIGAIPTSVLCPGDCFLTTAQFSNSYPWWYTNHLLVFTDFSPNVRITVPPPGTILSTDLPAYGLPISGILPSPDHYTGSFLYSIKPVKVCINKGSAIPITLDFYGYRNAYCNAYPLASGCNHDIEVRTVNVLNVPNYSHLVLGIGSVIDPLNNLSEICSGDPINICLRDAMGNVPPPGMPAPNITWECSTNGSPFAPVTYSGFSSSQFCFNVPQGVVTSSNCSAPSVGYEDKTFRATLVVEDPVTHQQCTYQSSEYNLRICCPITTPPTVVLNVHPPDALNGTLCEGDHVVIDVSLTGLPAWFPPSPGAVVTVDWFLNNVPIPGTAGLTQFPLSVTVGGTDLCFSVKIKNCGCPAVTAEQCIKVDSMPICGDIHGCSANLTLISTTPMLCYEICPFKDASLCMDNPADFDHGVPHWEFSFDPFATSPIWTDMGATNDVQNTNTLPQLSPPNNPMSPDLWLNGEHCIYYRIKCVPYSNPSGCDPCYSNTIKICWKATPAQPNVVINGPDHICKGSTVLLSVTNPEAVIYTWYCNGVVVQTGSQPTYTASQQAWYWVEADNGCEIVESNHVFLNVCMVTAIISCPLWPNACAKKGEEIYLSGCDSQSTCGGPLTYTWMASNGTAGTTIDPNPCLFSHFPDMNGTTYTLTVTDPYGCSDTTTSTIIPCQ